MGSMLFPRTYGSGIHIALRRVRCEPHLKALFLRKGLAQSLPGKMGPLSLYRWLVGTTDVWAKDAPLQEKQSVNLTSKHARKQLTGVFCPARQGLQSQSPEGIFLTP